MIDESGLPFNSYLTQILAIKKKVALENVDDLVARINLIAVADLAVVVEALQLAITRTIRLKANRLVQAGDLEKAASLMEEVAPLVEKAASLVGVINQIKATELAKK